MKTVLLTNNYTAEHSNGGFNEDVWWNIKIQNLPSEELAFEFSSELEPSGSTFDHLRDFIPTGAHKQWRYSPMKHMGRAFRFLQEQYGRCI
jgi:hypothetical protein